MKKTHCIVDGEPLCHVKPPNGDPWNSVRFVNRSEFGLILDRFKCTPCVNNLDILPN